MKVLVSACLLGVNCKYNGGNNLNANVLKFLEDKEVIPVCPEILGGLSIPRPPAEIRDGSVYDEHGNNVDKSFSRGALLAMRILEDNDIDCVILQSRSPSCGVRQIYDGSFSGTLIDGQGVFAKACIEAGYRVYDADEF